MALSSKQPTADFKSDFEENIEEIKEEWEQLKREKEQLDKERKDFTDAAIRMGVERANLLVILVDCREKRQCWKKRKGHKQQRLC